ncbi:MAG: acyl-CoA synthetase [Jatrophihabitans sp.]
MLTPAFTRARDEALALGTCVHSGLVGPIAPARAPAAALSLYRFGALGGVIGIAAARFGDRTAVIDDSGQLTYSELDRRTNAIANTWRARGLHAGDGVGLLIRNHRGFLEAVFAAAKCGARIVLLNTDFSKPQLADVARREGVDLLVYDEEFEERLTDIEARHGRWRAWSDTLVDDTLDAAAVGGETTRPPKPATSTKLIVLTSGTTGTPKGAVREDPRSLVPMGALLDRVPLRAREITECCVPLFHALGFAHGLLAVALGSTLVLRSRFDPVQILESIHRNQVTALIVVPIMLTRMLDAQTDVAPRTESLRIIFVAGSQLGAELGRRTLEAFGPVVYNLYGSTEVAYATIATPDDLLAEPACVGKTVRGVVMRILDDAGHELPTGQPGRIFVANSFQFEGYTGGGTKESIDGLMSSGDVGHVDEAGRLFIDGRDDDMIVSGGENVFPGEIEELLFTHPHIADAAVLGVPDPDYGHRLRAFVVPRSDGELTEDDVKSFVRENLARYKVPREVVLVDELPRNATGKILKRELRTRSEQ